MIHFTKPIEHAYIGFAEFKHHISEKPLKAMAEVVSLAASHTFEPDYLFLSETSFRLVRL